MQIRHIFALSILSLIAPLYAQNEATLEQILSEVQSLKAQVSSLETRLSELENAAISAPANTLHKEEEHTPITPTAQATQKDKKWYKNFGINLENADNKDATGKWTLTENWDKLEIGMKEEDVFAILGEPDRSMPTQKKYIDFIHIYRGYINNQTVKVQGKIKIYKGKLVGIEKPELKH